MYLGNEAILKFSERKKKKKKKEEWEALLHSSPDCPNTIQTHHNLILSTQYP